ncbi:Hemimethylated DNA-binding protein YccV like-domain-containing protein [Bisporella sp. PMI_857]|nr:Hemimethylated DNA-binding protein YccV like-domain-containing protein [Bisporella sp. PMI_857]
MARHNDNIKAIASPIQALPDEVLQHILSYISAQDIILGVQRVCKRFNRLANEPLLWRSLCKLDYNYWDLKHRIKQKFLGSVSDVDWKNLYRHRSLVDRQTTAHLDSILKGQIDRIKKFDSIGKFGYDAKDTLLRHCRTSDQAGDVLSRRYYATAVLDYVHRSKALAEWSRLAQGESVPIEMALGSFDLFVLHDQHGDLLEIAEIFDGLVARLRIEYPGLDQLTPRRKALAVVSFLRAHNLVGIDSELAYRDLQNNYIGIALQDPSHPALPLISVAIFCVVACRVGLDARCCGIPNHMHAMVYPKPSESLDGKGEDMSPMYLDPYRSEVEVPISNLREMLSGWGIEQRDFDRLLSDSTIPSLILRTSRNILATVHEFRGQGGDTLNTGHPSIRLYGNPFADMDNAFYSALWANFMLSSPTARSDGHNQQQFVPLILERFERLFPMDASLIEKHVRPLFNNPSNGQHWELHEALRVVRAADQTSKQLKPRDSPSARDRVRYRVGQVFRHRRYNYTAVITGWDIECGMNSDWMAHNNIDTLSRGRNQSFYHALTSSVEDTSIRYVAEDNIEIITPDEPTSLMGLAGRFFKRWDSESKTFISNIRDEFPED